MRRRGDGILVGGEIQQVEQEVARYGVDTVIAALDSFATDARRARIDGVLSRRLDAVTLVVDALHDPHNGAALARSCDAFGVQAMHAIERREPLALAASVSRGSHKWIEIVRHQSGAACVASLQGRGYELIATHPEGELEPEDLATLPRVALLMGNEREGIDPALRAACSRAVRVPMVGFVESLNVSVTAAILLHAATRRRPGDLDEARKRALYARALWLTVPRPAECLEEHLVRLASGARQASGAQAAEGAPAAGAAPGSTPN
jgi:tRNA (guanosine-2'-O-)-methyltransferase